MAKQSSEDHLCKVCNRELLLKYCEGQLIAEEKEQLEAHLMVSMSCWDQLIQLNSKLQIKVANDKDRELLPYTSEQLTELFFGANKCTQSQNSNRDNIVTSQKAFYTPETIHKLNDHQLIAGMIPINSIPQEQSLLAWETFITRHEKLIISTVCAIYQRSLPEIEITADQVFAVMETIFTNLQQDDYHKLRLLRDRTDISIGLYLYALTIVTLTEGEYFDFQGEISVELRDDISWEDASKRLAQLHCNKAYEIFVNSEPADRQVINRDTNNNHSLEDDLISKYLINKNLINRNLKDKEIASSQEDKQHLSPHKPLTQRQSIHILAMAVMLAIIMGPISMIVYQRYQTTATNSTQVVISQDVDSAKLTLYESLDQAVDQYIAAVINNEQGRSAEALTKAETISMSMEKTGDLFGKDLISFYKKQSKAALVELQAARRELIEVENTLPGDNYKVSLEKAERVKETFKNYSSQCDLERSKLQIIRLNIKLSQFDKVQEKISEIISQIKDEQHLFIYAQMIYRQADAFSSVSKFESAISLYKESIELGNRLSQSGFVLSPLMSLAGIYYIMDNNEEAFKLAQMGLTISRKYNNSITVQLLHIAGISSHNLRNFGLADDYLKEALAIAGKQQNAGFTIQSYMFLGIMLTDQKRMMEAQKYFDKCLATLPMIKEEEARMNLETSITGYYARQQMLAGNSDKALKMYNKALLLAEKTHLEQYLTLSQMHQGRAEVLMRKGNYKSAEKDLQLAISFEKNAQSNSETNNTLLSFAITNLSALEQLNRIRH